MVGPTAEVMFEGLPHSMPPKAAHVAGTVFVYEDRLDIVAGRFSCRASSLGAAALELLTVITHREPRQIITTLPDDVARDARRRMPVKLNVQSIDQAIE